MSREHPTRSIRELAGFRLVAAGAAALVLGLLAVSFPQQARAHPFLVTSSPVAGARLASAPPALVLTFSEPFAGGSERVALRDESGQPVAMAAPAAEANVLRQPLAPGLEGVFVVSYRVLGDDGHVTVGELAFAVGSAGSLPDLAGTSARTSPADVIASWLFVAGLALALGGLASELFVWRGVPALKEAAARAPVRTGLALAVAATVLQLVSLAAGRSGASLSAGLDPDALASVLTTRPGVLTLVSLAAVVLAAPIAAQPGARPLALVPLLVATLAVALRGHAGTSGHWWAVPVDALHLATAAAWVGALAHLLLVLRRAGSGRRRSTLAAGAARYARLAPVAVGTIAVTGALTALAVFTSPSQLLGTGYGRTLMVKAGIVLLVLGLAFAARQWALAPRGSSRLPPALRSRSASLGIVALALLIVALTLPGGGLRLVSFAVFATTVTYVVVGVRRLRAGGARTGPHPDVEGRRWGMLVAVGILGLFAGGLVMALAGSESGRQEANGDTASLLRAGLVALALVLALVAALRALPASRRLRAGLLGRLATGELLALAGVLAAASVLANVAPPPSAAVVESPALGPAPPQGPALRLADLAGQLTVGVTASSGELQFTILQPSGEPVTGAGLIAETDRPGLRAADLFPRPCGPGCFTIRFALPRGTTTVTVGVSAPGWKGGSARYELPWPLGPEEPSRLDSVVRAMRSVQELILTETVTSGPGSSPTRRRFRLSGAELLSTELYASGAVDVRAVTESASLTQLAFALPGSDIWYRMWIGPDDLVRKETIVSPGHLIQRAFEYPGRPIEAAAAPATAANSGSCACPMGEARPGQSANAPLPSPPQARGAPARAARSPR